MKVKLIQQTKKPIEFIAKIASICYDSNPKDPLALVKKLYKNGHHSVFEHVYFTFKIEGISRACYDDKTEVYTRRGWVAFKDIRDDDLFLTRTETGAIEWNCATDFISYDYSGDMISIKSQAVDLLTTPDHALLTKRFDVRTAENYGLHTAEEILGSSYKRFYMTKEIDCCNVSSEGDVVIKGDSYERKNKCGDKYLVNVPDLEINKGVFLRFLAWYLSEGSTYYNKKENSYTVTIYQTDSSENATNRADVENIVRQMGLTPYKDKTSIRFKSRQVGIYCKKLGISHTKNIPGDIWEIFDKNSAKAFIDEYAKADGHVDKNGHLKLFTTSKVLSDQLQMIAFIAGYTAKIIENNRVGESHTVGNNVLVCKHTLYSVSISKGKRNRTPVIKKDVHVAKIPYCGRVYCVEVPNHTLFVRRNGIVIWCGNCSHQLVRHRHCSFTQRSQRYCEETGFEFVLPKKAVRGFGGTMAIMQMHYNEALLAGVPAEDARYILPNACKTSLYLSCNLRELIHMANERTCLRAQWEIRELVWQMIEAVDESLHFMLVPKCEAPHLNCLEPCGGK